MSISLPTLGIPGLLDGAAPAAPAFSASNPANLAHWYNLDSLARLWQDSAQTTAVASDGDPIGSWVDQIVSADDAAQATADNRPTYRAAVVALNSQPAAEFDGSNDYLQGAYSASLSQPNTIFIVDQRTVVVSSRASVGGDDSAHRHAILNSGTTAWRINAGTSADGGTPNTNANILCAVFNGASSTLHVNGVSAISGNAGAHEADGITIGAIYNAANPMTGYIAEILVYNANLSASDKNLVQNYLAAKYSISVTEFS